MLHTHISTTKLSSIEKTQCLYKLVNFSRALYWNTVNTVFLFTDGTLFAEIFILHTKLVATKNSISMEYNLEEIIYVTYQA